MKNSITNYPRGNTNPIKKLLTAPKFLTFLIAFIFFTSAFSQDDIMLLNNTHIQGRVEEVGVSTIKYRMANNLDGPIHDVRKSDVASITYANGEVENYTQGNTPAAIPAASGNDDNIAAPVKEAPPALPVYEQPACPVQGYIWTPGYWAMGPAGYYWVPGVWVNSPRLGYLWTPCYWGFVNGVYVYHEGYWGEHIGYYGGVSYGFGYGGHGYDGGRWEGGVFRYNTAVSHVDITVVHTTYVDKTVVNTTVVNRSSFNGEGGVKAEPTANEKMHMNEAHVNPTSEQQSHITAAKNDKSQYASNNGGKPAVASKNKTNGQHFSSEGKITTPHPNSQPQPQHAITTKQQQQLYSGGPTKQPQQYPAANTKQQQNAPNTTQQKPASNPSQQQKPVTNPQPGQHPAGITQKQNVQPAQPQQHPAMIGTNKQLPNNKTTIGKPSLTKPALVKKPVNTNK